LKFIKIEKSQKFKGGQRQNNEKMVKNEIGEGGSEATA